MSGYFEIRNVFADSCWRVSGLFYPKVQKFLVMFLLKVAILGYKNHIILTHGKMVDGKRSAKMQGKQRRVQIHREVTIGVS